MHLIDALCSMYLARVCVHTTAFACRDAGCAFLTLTTNVDLLIVWLWAPAAGESPYSLSASQQPLASQC